MRVVLISLYDDQAVGIRCLSNALFDAGHEVAVIHFKASRIKPSKHFARYTESYQTISSFADVIEPTIGQWCSDVSPWTVGEVRLLSAALKRLKPGIVGLTTRCVYRSRMHEIVAAMKSCGAKTVVGGHDASFSPEFYKNLGVDHVCIGDGEDAIVALANGVDPKKIPNLDGNSKDSVQTKPVHFFHRENTAAHYLLEKNVLRTLDPHSRNLEPVNYFTFFGKGCSGRCSFCSAGAYNRLHKPFKTRVLRSIHSVCAECRHAAELGFKQIYFLDSYFVAPKVTLLSLFERYKGPRFFAQLEPVQVLRHPEVLDAAVKAGLFQTVVGFQSGSERVNREVFNRKTSHKDLIAFAGMCVDRGVEVHYHFITHNPWETEEDKRALFDLIPSLPVGRGTGMVSRPLNIFPNTGLWEKPRPKGNTFERDCWWSVLNTLKFKVPEIEYDESATIEGMREAYRGALWRGGTTTVCG